MNEEKPELELWLPEIKKYIYSSIEDILKAAKFAFHKSGYSYKRTHAKNFEEFSFLFSNEFPVKYRVGYLMQVWNHDIKMIKAGFPGHSQVENYKMRSLVFFMNHFRVIRDRDSVVTLPNFFLLITYRDLWKAADHIIASIRDQGIPLADQLSTIQGIDGFFIEHPSWSVDSLNFNNMTSELIAAKLSGVRDFNLVYEQMQKAVMQKIDDLEMEPAVASALENFYAYLKQKAKS